VKYIQLTLLALILSSAAFGQSCAKQLLKNEKYKSGPIVYSKTLTFHSPTVTNQKKISFQVKDSSRFFVHFDVGYGSWPVGSRVELEFESGEVLTTYVTFWETERVGTSNIRRYDCQVTDQDMLEKMYSNKVEKVKISGINKSFDFSSKKKSKLMSLFICTVNAIGADNINYSSAKQMEADPYVDNSIQITFGDDNNSTGGNTTNNTTNDISVNCEYEKNEVDEFTGEKTVLTKKVSLGNQLSGQLQLLNENYYLNLFYDGPLGCVNVESFIIIKFADASTLKLMNVAKEDCGGAPKMKIDLSSNLSILKVRDIEKIRISMSDAQADITLSDKEYIKGVLLKCM